MLKLNTVDYDNLFCYHVPNNTKNPQNKNKKIKQNKKTTNKPEVCIMIKLVTVVFSVMIQKSVQNIKEVKTFCSGRYNLPDYYQIMKYKSN